MTNNVKYRSGDFSKATPIGVIRNESPLLPFSNEVLIFHQDFVQLASAFVALDYNTPNPDIGGRTAFLIAESPREDFGGRCVKWTRSWARVPDSYNMPGGNYQYQFPGIASKNSLRSKFTTAAKLTIHRDFFLCGNNGVANGGYSQWQDIPATPGFRIQNALPEDPDTLDVDTIPSAEEYLALVANGTPIQIEDSKILPWQGSIFVRENYFIIAR